MKKNFLILRLLFVFFVGFATLPASAGTMTQAELVRRFPPPYLVGDKDTALPVWPIFKKNMTSTELVAYVFESIDFAPIPGFSGVPMNLLIALDPLGTFVDVKVLSHHEPVFLDGLGEAPLFKFVSQYQGISLKQSIKISTGNMSRSTKEAANVYIDGVSKATASVRILNQSALSAALKVARKKLGFAEGRDPDLIARIRPDTGTVISPAALRQRGLIQPVIKLNRDVEAIFVGTNGAGLDAVALAQPDAPFVNMEASYVSVPAIGRNLLGAAGWAKLSARLEPGDHAIMLVSNGRYGVVGDDFTRGAVPDRLALKQGTLPIEIRDLDLDIKVDGVPDNGFKIFRVISQSGLDPSLPLEFFLHVTRSKGILYPEKISRDLRFSITLPARFYVAAEPDNKTWRAIWWLRWWELAVLGVALTLLSVALVLQKKLVAHERRFVWFRRGFLVFTAVFIGWYAQGQLSIVNLTSVVQSLMAGRSLTFLLYDPMSVSLWAFVLVSLLVWGRGTFCGWLCPFGALQEFTGKLGQWLKFPQLMIRPVLDGRLKLLKYVLLVAILGSAFFSATLTDKLVELEPFKTAITLNFVRSWPYVAYAVGLLVLSMFSYKFFCRYLCPFGAGLAVLGRFRLLNWLPRRAACGTPCQTCRHSCEYKAIKPGGAIQYDECFQCLDCVVIYESDDKCAPLIMEKKRARIIPIEVVPVKEA
ncbi:4Fe-4S binding protein [Actimicrobium sp. CCI2.3]|uniref:4Fe-4S binding protein n=1 Tax=Actimicrobium sp. CCI2.3 TaxID=3048616 RepID=UPI002AB54370|nr:4Fe-4S binding protein [Actimicrobium sp. CCI2.3]MDY7575483.1 4Fe-4S binding protein [Actimicrobium sp. CCI2.3]MEB0024118.1 4Fe-4S binding protein [Actimicrobium sp. CCI2.3]